MHIADPVVIRGCPNIQITFLHHTEQPCTGPHINGNDKEMSSGQLFNTSLAVWILFTTLYE